jgi:hypothetical protein
MTGSTIAVRIIHSLRSEWSPPERDHEPARGRGVGTPKDRLPAEGPAPGSERLSFLTFDAMNTFYTNLANGPCRDGSGLTALYTPSWRTPMKAILVLAGSTIMIAACSRQSTLPDLSLPTTSPMHIRALDPHHGESPYIVTAWGLPIAHGDEFATD